MKIDSNLLHQQIVSLASDAILFADQDGVIQLWNLGAENIFGYTAKEAIGQSLELIIPDNLRQRHNDGYVATMQSGHSKYGNDLLSVPAVHKDGHRLFCDFSIVMIKADNGEMLGIASIMRDATAQKAKDKELRERIKVLETEGS